MIQFFVIEPASPSFAARWPITNPTFSPLQGPVIGATATLRLNLTSPIQWPFSREKFNQWIGLGENLQESTMFNGEIYGFL